MDDSHGSVGQKVADIGGRVGDTAGQQMQTLAGKAKEQAGEVASATTNELVELSHRVTDDIRAQASGQTARLAGNVRTLGAQLRAASEGRPDDAGPVRDYLVQGARRADELAGRLEHGGVEGMARDIGRFARRRPVVFLLGAGLAGLLAGRFARAQRDGPQRDNRDGPGDLTRAAGGGLVEPTTGIASPAAYRADPTAVTMPSVPIEPGARP